MDKDFAAGVEISRDELLVFARGSAQRVWRKRFANTPQGHQALRRWLRRLGGTVRVAMESTGTYGLDLALVLASEDPLEVIQANPRAVRDFARAWCPDQKSDPLDAQVLMEFAARMPVRPWQPPGEQRLQLRAVMRRLSSLVEQATAEKNRLHASGRTETTPRAVAEVTEALIESLEQAIERLEQEALALVQADSRLAEDFKLLVSVPGIAQRTALRLLGELGVLGTDFTAKQWVAHAGIYPRNRLSGRSIRFTSGVGKSGNKYLKQALFMPALVATQRSEAFRRIHDKLVGQGLTSLQATVAVMRRLLHVIHALLRTRQPFEPSKVGTA